MDKLIEDRLSRSDVGPGEILLGTFDKDNFPQVWNVLQQSNGQSNGQRPGAGAWPGPVLPNNTQAFSASTLIRCAMRVEKRQGSVSLDDLLQLRRRLLVRAAAEPADRGQRRDDARPHRGGPSRCSRTPWTPWKAVRRSARSTSWPGRTRGDRHIWVGMEDRGTGIGDLLTLLIPYYSTKGASVGRVGLDFFNVYRRAEQKSTFGTGRARRPPRSTCSPRARSEGGDVTDIAYRKWSTDDGARAPASARADQAPTPNPRAEAASVRTFAQQGFAHGMRPKGRKDPVSVCFNGEPLRPARAGTHVVVWEERDRRQAGPGWR